jgi:hypothetical protein
MEARARYSLHVLRVLLVACVSLCVTSLAHAQSVTVAWDANTEPNLAGYVVFYGTSSGIYPYSIDVGNVTTKQVTANLTANTRFYFVVKAYDTGWKMSPASNEVSVVTGGTTNPPPPPPPPPPPTAPTLTSLSPTSGPKQGGTLITLNGTNFVSGAKVYVGGVLSPTITFVSAAQVKAVTPKGAVGQQTVTITNPSGQSAAVQNAFQYTGAKPKILTSSPTMGSLSGGTELRISGEFITTDVGVVVGGTSAQVTHLDSNSLIAIAPPRSAPGLVDVSLIEAGQVQSTLAGAFRYQQLTSPDDTDGDGLTNAWETQWGLNPNSADGDNGAAGDPDDDGVLNIDEKNAGTHPRGFVKRYLAEGVVNFFFDTRIALANPQNEAARVLLEFQDTAGQTYQKIMELPARSRRTLVARDEAALADKNFATRVESDQMIVVDRLMRWEATFFGSHAETAIAEPSTTWYFAEGATSGPFDLFYLLQNPSDQSASVDIRFLRPHGAPPVMRTYEVGPRSRRTIDLDSDEELKTAEVSAELTSTIPIIAERSMYFSSVLPFWGGHGSAGVTAPAKEWFLAEGATGSFFTMFVLIANPTNQAANVKVTYLLDNGSPVVKTYQVDANSRFNIYVNGEHERLANTTVASRYESDVPIIVERTMWWPGSPSQWTEGHNSFGVTSTGTKWAVAEGEAGGAQNSATFILVANTSPFTGQAKVTLLFEDGGPEISQTIELAPNSRKTVTMDGPFAAAIGKRFATVVESLGATPAQIVIERAMYSDSRGLGWSAGSNAVGTKLQ